jgi:hypothetical protein
VSKKRIFLGVVVALALAFVVLVVLSPPPPPPALPEPPPPPAVKRPKPALQADAEGRYTPGYAFSVGRFRFTGFSLHPDAVVTFTSAGTEQALFCPVAAITAATVRLRCDDPAVGVVTIEGKFLRRLVTSNLGTPALSAVVTVRAGGGEVLYSARDSFLWEPGR